MLRMLIEGHPTWRRIATWTALRLADLAVLTALIGLSQSNEPTFGFTNDAVAGVPMGVAMAALGLVLSSVGWAWIRRIARGNPEPEANDQFWWSRA